MHVPLEDLTPWRLDGFNALVTGGSRGIGKAIAASLLERGANVFITARSQQDLFTTVTEWRLKDLPVEGYTTDITSEEGRKNLLAHIYHRWDRLDILVNNAGTNIRKESLQYDKQDWTDIMETNLTAQWELTRTAHPLFRISPFPSVTFVTSVAGLTHVGSGAPYGMSKAALHQLTRNLAVEWGKEEIRVNAVAPWYVTTPLTENLLNKKAFKEAVLARTPLQRIGTPEDVARAVTFLSLPAASWITGQVLAVDGGFSANGFEPPADRC